MKETIVKLSTGEEVKVRPLTMREAKKCNFISIMKKFYPKEPMNKKEIEKGDIEISLRDIGVDENDIMNVDRIFYPKVEDLAFQDAWNIFITVFTMAGEVNF